MFVRVLAVMALAAAVLAAGRQGAGTMRVLQDPEDLRAFYCAGKTVAAHADPYRAEPLRTCEVREARAGGLAPYEQLAVPAPLPGYAFVPLAFASLAPFTAVEDLYVLAIAAAFVLTVMLVAKLSAFPWPVVAAALVLSDGVISMANGQILPFALLALCAAALELARGHPARASIYAACATIEPHVALPALIALACAVPKTRLPLALSALVLGAVALLTLGVGPNLEYIAQVLPAHAKSEATAVSQFSLTTLLARAGVGLPAAIGFGELWYVGLSALGIAAGIRLARSLEAPELLVLVPPAFGLLGGPFVHLTQIAVVIPTLFALGRRLPEQRGAIALAIMLLALPWQDLVENAMPAVIGISAVVTLTIALGVWRPARRDAAIALLAFVALAAFEKTLHDELRRPSPDATAAIAAADRPGALAEATWTAFNAAADNADPRAYLASHAPTWTGLTMLVFVTVRRRYPKPARYAAAVS